MAKKSDEYWQKRFEILQEALLNKSDKYFIELIKQYERASRNVQDKILAWYIRLAENNEVSFTRAKQMLTNQELEEFRWSIEEYIRHGQENAISQQWIKELENASVRVHISKLEAMQIEIQQQVEALAGSMDVKLPELLQEIYTEGYYQTAYELQKGTNTVRDIKKLDTATIEKTMSKPWTVDKKTFSDRIWSNKEQLIDTLNKDLTQSIIRGDAPDKLIKNIADKFETSKRQTGRLVMTESAYFSSQSRLDSYKDLGVEKYKIVATLDLKTSEKCRGLDSKVFNINEYKVNITAPPFHVNCRSTTAPYYEDLDDIIGGQRAARDPVTGKTEYVNDKTYSEWYEKRVKGNPQAELNEKKLKNASADQSQYNEYKQKLGPENIPKTLDVFQEIKYTNETEYGILKAQVKGMTYYDKAVLNEPDITNQVKQVAERTGMNILGLDYRIKGKDSYLRKIRTNYKPEGNEYEINDILRYTYGADVKNLSTKTLESIDKYSTLGYNTVKVKNSWLDKDNPYNGINTIIQSPNGQKFELQYHTPESFELKNGKLHELYEKQRVIMDKDSEEYIDLTDKMFELSDKLTTPINIERVK